MKPTSISTLFLVAVVSLAVVGTSYAAWTSEIFIRGTVNTGSLQVDITEYSGTTVWKVYGTGAPADEVYIQHWSTNGTADPMPQTVYPNATCVEVAWAGANASSSADYDIDMYWQNVFPLGTALHADFVLQYQGTVPAKINAIVGEYDVNSSWVDDYLSYEVYARTGPSANWTLLADPLGYQMHQGYELHVLMWLDLPQLPELMNRTASGHVAVQFIQWNEYTGAWYQEGNSTAV
jgi:hypothetical protein